MVRAHDCMALDSTLGRIRRVFASRVAVPRERGHRRRLSGARVIPRGDAGPGPRERSLQPCQMTAGGNQALQFRDDLPILRSSLPAHLALTCILAHFSEVLHALPRSMDSYA